MNTLVKMFIQEKKKGFLKKGLKQNEKHKII